MKKMIPSKIVAARIAAGILTASTVFLPRCSIFNTNECVYGPPSFFGQSDPSSNVNEDVYGPPSDFDPDDNINECVYGPPEEDLIDPEADENVNPPVYGPPESELPDPVDPAENVPDDVYGPPAP